MTDDTFEQKLATQKAHSSKTLPYPKKWLLTDQEQEKMLSEAAAAIDLFNEDKIDT